MTPVGRALHFRRENENLSSSADVLHKTKNLAISRCCFADDGNELDKSQPRSQGLLRFQDGGAEKTLAHTVTTPPLIGLKI